MSQIEITGMSCASCVGRVEKIILSHAEVKEVTVSLPLGKAKIEWWDEGHHDKPLDSILSALSKSGYPSERAAKITAKTFEDPAAVKSLALGVFSAAGSVLVVSDMFLHFLSTLQSFLICITAMIVLGIPSLSKGIRSFNMDTLVSVGAFSAFFLSLYMWVELGASASPHDLYFESASVILFFVTIGRWLEGEAKKSTLKSLTDLSGLRPTLARKWNKETSLFEETPIGQIEKGDELEVLPGQRVPADGQVKKGEGYVNESMITGESSPLHRKPGDRVLGGSQNGFGRFTMTVDTVFEGSFIDSLIGQIESAQLEKAPLQRLVDQISSYFVQGVFVLSALTVLVWFLFTGEMTGALVNGISVLVVACPCALGLATPSAVLVGTGLAAKRGILFKSPTAIEKGHGVQAVVLDKTGTITEAELQVTKLNGLKELSGKELSAVVSLISANPHPVGKALALHMAKAPPVSQAKAELESVELHPGKGLLARVDGETYAFGSANWVHSLMPTNRSIAAQKNQTVIGNTSQGRVLLSFEFTEQVKDQTREAIESLQSMGIEVFVATGDKREKLETAVQGLSLSGSLFEARPDDKLNFIKKLQAEQKKVAMVGDGVNDGPALAQADFSMSMGSGSDLAEATSDVVLLNSDPKSIVAALLLARATQNKIKQNLFWAFFYNFLLLPLAAFGMLSPTLAGLAMSLSSVSVVVSSLLLNLRS